jgi:hypothetical protein
LLGYISYGRKNKVGACLLELCSIHQMCVYICMYVCKVVGACSCSLKLVEVCFIHPVCVCMCVCVCVCVCDSSPTPFSFFFHWPHMATKGTLHWPPREHPHWPQSTANSTPCLSVPWMSKLVFDNFVLCVQCWWDAEQWLQWTVSPGEMQSSGCSGQWALIFFQWQIYKDSDKSYNFSKPSCKWWCI